MLCSGARRNSLRAVALTGSCGLAAYGLRENAELAALVPLAAVIAGVAAVGLWRERASRDPAHVARFCVALVALLAPSPASHFFFAT